MKKLIIGLSIVVMAVQVQAQKGKPVAKAPVKAPAKSTTFKNTNDSLSYAFGVSLGNYLNSQGLKKINFALLNQAISTKLAGKKTAFDNDVANMLMGQLAEEKMKRTAVAEKKKGTDFLASNKKKQGVVETASGLQYEILKAGNGPIPKITDTIVAHYKGTLLDGREFDNSYSRGEPITIPVGGVIQGWIEALQMMPVGSKWKIYIPSDLGYGDYGSGPTIPGGATLVFEMELLEIKNKPVTQ